jgi:hypothetical protein
LLTHPTLDQLHQLGLAGMARAFVELEANPTSAALSHAEWLALLARPRSHRTLRTTAAGPAALCLGAPLGGRGGLTLPRSMKSGSRREG